MANILYKSGILVLVIILGYVLKLAGLFSKERDFKTLSTIILYITLPAALINNLNGLRFPIVLLLLSVFGFLCNWLYIFIGKKFGKTPTEQSFMMLNINGYNIGNFSLPFISYFLEGIPILAISLFDAGSAVMVLGGNYAVAEGVQKEETKFQVKELFRKVLQSPSIIVYAVMVILSIASIDLPVVVTDFTAIVGSANTFLAMFMIGVALELNFSQENITKLLKYTFLRYVPAFVMGLVISFIPVIPLEIKYTIILILLAPVAGSAPIFTERIGNDVGLSAQMNSLSVMISILLMSGYLIFIGL